MMALPRSTPTPSDRKVLEHLANGTDGAIHARAVPGEDRFIDVGQPDLESNPIGTVQKVYASPA
jgi:hypothetical protein